MNTKASIKRTFKEIRMSILSCLATGQHTINQISYKKRINWKTVELHLTYLVGKGLVQEIFSSEYVRIFALTELGKSHMRSLGYGSFELEESVSNII